MENTKATEKIVQGDIVLKVRRELIQDAKTKSGDDMYAYVLRETFLVNGREREFRVDFTAKDYGGYDMLDIIFMINEEAYLSVYEGSMTDENTGEVNVYTVYEIWNKDDDGVLYTYKIKPFKESDKAKVNVIIQKKQLALELEKAKTGAKKPEKEEK